MSDLNHEYDGKGDPISVMREQLTVTVYIFPTLRAIIY